jgi:hypothetical protein
LAGQTGPRAGAFGGTGLTRFRGYPRIGMLRIFIGLHHFLDGLNGVWLYLFSTITQTCPSAPNYVTI